MTNEAIIRIENISKYYIAEGKVIPALEKTSLSFASTGLVAVIGESGSGKTTLLNLIAGNLSPDSGFVYFGNKKIAELEETDLVDYRKRQIGFIYQDFELISHYTARENIMSSLLLSGESLQSAREKTDELLNKVELKEHADIKVCKLSAGQRQRVGIARVLARESKIILADEPTANLDPESGKQIMDLLKKCSEDHLIILVTHNLEQARSYATRIITMRRGRVEEDSAPNTYDLSPEVDANPKKSPTKGHKIPLLPLLKWDIKSSMLQNVLVFLFLSMTGLILIFFYNTYYINTDETPVKIFEYSAFQNNSMERIAVVRKDGDKVSATDLTWAQGLKHVKSVDLYDSTADIRYYLEEGKDYEYSYHDAATQRTVKPLRNNNFVRSVTALSDNDLYAGQLPEKENEIVLCTDDQSLLGEEYNSCLKLVIDSNDVFYYQKFKVIGLVCGNSGQAYFSNALCDMLNAYYEAPGCRLNFFWKESTQTYEQFADALLQIDKNLSGNTVITRKSYLSLFRNVVPKGKCQLEYRYYTDAGIISYDRKTIDVNVIEKDYTNEEQYVYTLEMPNGTIFEGAFSNESSYPFIDVSEEVFYTVYDTGSRQMSIYVDDYAYLDRVLEKIDTSGNYIATSTYRMAAKDISDELNAKREQLLNMSLFVLFITIGTIIFVICIIYMVRNKDYVILNKLGMNPILFRLIFLVKLAVISLAVMLSIAITLAILYNTGTTLVIDYLKYLRLPQYITCVIYFMAAVTLGSCLYTSVVRKSFH